MATRIMVINNSDEILASFHKILAADKYEVIAQVYLDADLREVQRLQPDLIILDYYVGQEGIDWQYLQLLRMEDSTASIPVMVCTTAVQLAYEIAGYLATKRVTILRKPFESHELLNAVRDTLHHSDELSSVTPFGQDGAKHE